MVCEKYVTTLLLGVWLGVTVCGGSSLWVVLYAWLEGCLLKLARKEKKKTTDLEVGDWLHLLLHCQQPLA